MLSSSSSQPAVHSYSFSLFQSKSVLTLFYTECGESSEFHGSIEFAPSFEFWYFQFSTSISTASSYQYWDNRSCDPILPFWFLVFSIQSSTRRIQRNEVCSICEVNSKIDTRSSSSSSPSNAQKSFNRNNRNANRYTKITHCITSSEQNSYSQRLECTNTRESTGFVRTISVWWEYAVFPWGAT